MAVDASTALGRRRTTAGGLLRAALIALAWAAAVGWAVFGRADARSAVDWLQVPLLIALITWLDVGLFIVAHDAMHGSLAPLHPRLNAAIGRTALALYAGFSYDRFRPQHMAHHHHPGRDGDPDFHRGRDGFWPWYGAFMRRYLGWRETLGLAGVFALLAVAGADPARLLLFWALPALLASLQLFAFGTWLPHRGGETPFADHHNARSNDYRPLASLLSCFHFGYHHEHHLRPDLPWWRLPALRAQRLRR